MSEAHFAKTVAWLLRVQALLAGMAAVLFAVIGGLDQALAALIGGGIGVVLTAVTALRIGLSLSQDPQAMIGAFYRAMAFKLVLAVILFVIVAKWFSGYFGPVLIGYVATIAAYWLAMWRMAHIPPNVDNQE
ncbi:MAG: ATP synthase subunit I [Wenzhouxiangella sp.]